MSKKELYEGKLILDLPESFEYMTENELERFFPNTEIDYAYIARNIESVIGIAINDVELNKNDVEQRITDYYNIYSRMTPGFVMGEIKKKDNENNSCAIFSFKSNAPTRDLFNIVSVTNFFGKELFIIISGNMDDSTKLIPECVKMIDSMNICE